MPNLLDLALQPSVLSMGTDRARVQFMHDLNQRRTLQMTSRAEREAIERSAFDERVRRGEKSKHGTPLRFRPSNPNQYMLDAIMRDAAIQQYDSKIQSIRASVDRDGADAPAWAQQAVLP